MLEANKQALIEQINTTLTSPVAVLFGGATAERAVSINSGRAVCDALLEAGIDIVEIDAVDNWLVQLLNKKVKHAFVILHGGAGEDGTVQGALKTAGISYTGSGVMACALAMDKARTKQLWLGSNMPTPAWAELNQDSDWQQVLNDLNSKVVVKPANEGSSVGMALAETARELQAAFTAAEKYGDVVLAEQWIGGGEYTVAIVNGEVLPAIKLEPANDFYDYEAKYLSDDTVYRCPCGLSKEQEQRLADLSLQAFNSVGCEGWGRVDFMREGDEFYALEINTVPGMTDHSLVPMAAKAYGLDFQTLVLNILADSLEVKAC
ncbi:MAG: D-alanine--D-alanine ligase [Sinobacterium sp.]|jgi:D-alanine-D-alanine ligase